MVDKSKWKESDINVDSLWIIPQRDNSGKHSNIYHGNFIPQIPYQLISRYTTMEDIVMELFSGSGTTLFECEKLNIKYIGYDINQDIIDYVNNKMQDSNIEYLINNCDVTDKTAFDKCTIESMKNLDSFSSVSIFFLSNVYCFPFPTVHAIYYHLFCR